MNTRIDSPYCTGPILSANAFGMYHTTYCVGEDGDCPPQLSMKRNFTKVDSSPLDPPEPSYMGLHDAFYRNPNNWDSGMREVYRLGREHGRQEVAKRLPRLWGLWCWPLEDWSIDDHKALAPFLVTDKEIAEQEVRQQPDDLLVREFDPMTGRPKG